MNKVKRSFWRTFKNYFPVFIVLTETLRQNLEPIPSYSKEIGAIFTLLSWVSPDHHFKHTKIVLSKVFFQILQHFLKYYLKK